MNYFATDLLMSKKPASACCGVMTVCTDNDDDGLFHRFNAKNTIIATGVSLVSTYRAKKTYQNQMSGALLNSRTSFFTSKPKGYSKIYQSTTAPNSCTGDGCAMVSRAGLNSLQDLEFVQFHPTGLYGSGEFVSGNIRAQGGYLVNGLGERFMEKYDPKKKDLTSRSLLCKCISKEIEEGRGFGPLKDHVLLKSKDGDKEIPVVPTGIEHAFF